MGSHLAVCAGALEDGSYGSRQLVMSVSVPALRNFIQLRDSQFVTTKETALFCEIRTKRLR